MSYFCPNLFSKEIVKVSGKLGIEYLTLYAFSTENWNRPKFEIEPLMSLLVTAINEETKDLIKNNVKLLAIGDHDSLPSKVRKKLYKAIEQTQNCNGLTLTLALSYSAKWEIIEAVKKISLQVKNNDLDVNEINDVVIDNNLSTSGIPHPELMIRTSGEYRISNFLLWQLAYAELYFTEKYWPDFNEKEFIKAIIDYQQRERRFGKTSEQIK